MRPQANYFWYTIGQFVDVSSEQICCNWSRVSKSFKAHVFEHWIVSLKHPFYFNLLNLDALKWAKKHSKYIKQADWWEDGEKNRENLIFMPSLEGLGLNGFPIPE